MQPAGTKMMCTNGNRFFSQSRNSAAMCTLQAHRGSRGLFPTHDPYKLKSNYLNSIRNNPHPLDYLYILGGVSSPHPPKTIFLRRDILFVRYIIGCKVFLAGKLQTYGHIRCLYTVPANPVHKAAFQSKEAEGSGYGMNY